MNGPAWNGNAGEVVSTRVLTIPNLISFARLCLVPVFLVALAWQVYQLSNTPGALSLVGVAISAPQVAFLLLGGAVSDRMDRRRVMLASDVVRGLALLALGALTVSGGLHLAHLYALGAIYGAATAFFGPAHDAVVPELVPGELLIQANSLDQFARPLALALEIGRAHV